MTAFDAFHLPGLEEDDVAGWETREFQGGRTRLRFPVLRPDGLARLLGRLRQARARELEDAPVARIVDAIDRAAARLQDDDALRRPVEDALAAITGFSDAMARLVLGRMLADWRRPALERLLHAELGDPGVLDAFRPHPAGLRGLRVRALGPELAFHVFAGNVPGVAVTSLVRSLLAKAATLGKTAAAEPLLPPLFARAIDRADPGIGACLAVIHWPGGTRALEDVALHEADTVVVYGGEEAAAELRRRTPPGKRLVVHGPRFSFGLVAADALGRANARRTAARVARAVAIFDQQGCVSPHLVYAERDGEVDPEAFAELVAHELGLVEDELPRGRLSAEEAAAVHRLRTEAEFRAIAGRNVKLHAGPGLAYTVVYDEDPAFAASCLNRTLWVKPIGRLEDAAALVRPGAAYLQTVAVAGAADRLESIAHALARAGVSRITDFERMPFPDPTWHHDGGEPLRELLRWADLEDPPR